MGSFPGPRSMRVKQDRPSALWEHASAPQQTTLRVHWAAWPGRGLGEPPPSWEEWGVEETTLPAQDPSCSPDTRSHPPAPVATQPNADIAPGQREAAVGTGWEPPTHARHPPLLTISAALPGPPCHGLTPRAGGTHARAPLAPRACSLLAPQQPTASLTPRAERTRLGCQSGGVPARCPAAGPPATPAHHPISLQRAGSLLSTKNVSFKAASQRPSRRQVRAGARRGGSRQPAGRHSTGSSHAGAWPCPTWPRAPSAHTDPSEPPSQKTG